MWRIIGFVLTGFIIVVACTLICVGIFVGIRKACKFFRKRKNAEENGNNEEGNVLAIGGGNSSEDVLTTKNEVKEKKGKKKKIDWADQDGIIDLVNSLPRKLPVSRNTV